MNLVAIIIAIVLAMLLIMLFIASKLTKTAYFENSIMTTFVNYNEIKYVVSLYYDKRYNYASLHVFKTNFNGKFIKKPFLMPEPASCYFYHDFNNFDINKWNELNEDEKKNIIYTEITTILKKNEKCS